MSTIKVKGKHETTVSLLTAHAVELLHTREVLVMYQYEATVTRYHKSPTSLQGYIELELTDIRILNHENNVTDVLRLEIPDEYEYLRTEAIKHAEETVNDECFTLIDDREYDPGDL